MNLYTVTVTKKNWEFLENLPSTINDFVSAAIKKQSEVIASNIRQKYFTSSFGMYSPGSELQQKVLAKQVLKTMSSVMGGIDIGDERTSAFVGEPKQIRPKSARALAIPTSRAAYYMQKSVGSLRQLSNLERGPGGLYDKSQGKKGKPLFVFRKSVNITPKIKPEDIASQYTPLVTVAVQNAVFEALKGV